MNRKPVVILDACVLYPYYLRDFLIHLSFTSKLYFPKWTAKIQEEWSRNLLKNHKTATPEKVSRIIRLMNIAIDDALIPESSYLDKIKTLKLPDQDDLHVLAAAISDKTTPKEERIQAIVTFNLKDFPDKTLKAYNLKAITPDELVLNLCSADINGVIKAISEQAGIMKNPPQSVFEIISYLEKGGLQRSTRLLRNYLAQQAL